MSKYRSQAAEENGHLWGRWQGTNFFHSMVQPKVSSRLESTVIIPKK